MKTYNFLKTILGAVISWGIILSCNNSKQQNEAKTSADTQTTVVTKETRAVPFLKPIDPCEAKRLNDSFISYKTKHTDLTFKKKYFKIPANKIDAILAKDTTKFLLAVISIDTSEANNKELLIEFVGSNSNGNGIHSSTSDLPKIRKIHKLLKDKHNSSNKIPLIGLNDFPIVIKLDTAGLNRVRRDNDHHYYFYPGIDMQWHDGSSNDPIHFTLIVTGYELDCKKDKNPLTEHPVEETWPYESFVWYNNGDIPGLEMP